MGADHNDLEDRLAQLSARVVVAEAIMATCVGFVLRPLPAALRDGIITELRSAIVIEPGGFPDPESAERMGLLAEHHAQQLIDQIERFSRSNTEERRK